MLIYLWITKPVKSVTENNRDRGGRDEKDVDAHCGWDSRHNWR
jgi:hypothetical protein